MSGVSNKGIKRAPFTGLLQLVDDEKT